MSWATAFGWVPDLAALAATCGVLGVLVLLRGVIARRGPRAARAA